MNKAFERLCADLTQVERDALIVIYTCPARATLVLPQIMARLAVTRAVIDIVAGSVSVNERGRRVLNYLKAAKD